MEDFCRSQKEALEELARVAPDAPFLALGQTVFWDEPMKASVILMARRLGHERRFIAGVHDTDYFAKAPFKSKKRGFTALAHNDTTTKGLWSAAGEFSTLFGSETIISKEALHRAGAKVARVEHERPGYLDRATEAWGWRGVVSHNSESQTTAAKPLWPLFRTLYDTLDWAVEESLNHIAGSGRHAAVKRADELRSAVCDLADPQEQTLSGYYRRLLPFMYSFAAGEKVEPETTATTELLLFNTQTASRPRFDLVTLFLQPESRDLASGCYDEVVAGSEIYPLDRFGTGALPFDLYIPNHGRGTLRLGNRGGVVMTPDPQGFSFKKRPESAAELAELIEKKFGPDCVLIGKAITLIGMLAREHVFVFHEGASSYVWRSRAMHQCLAESGHKLELNPILRVAYEPWDALTECCGSWLRLPDPMRRAFGVEELSAPSLAARWREVCAQQRERLKGFGQLRRPLELIRFLQSEVGGQWTCMSHEYEQIHGHFLNLSEEIKKIKERKQPVLAKIRDLKRQRSEAEQAKGRHWRDRIFEKSPTKDDLNERGRLSDEVHRIAREIEAARDEWRALQDEQEQLVGSEEAMRCRTRRQSISLEAELMRMTLIREAIISSDGLEKAGHRPSAWWMPLVCPSGKWFQATARRARFYLEPLN